VFRNAIEKIHRDFYAELDSFRQDDLSVFDATCPVLEACLLGQSAPDKKRPPVIVLVAAAMILLLAGGFIWYRIQAQAKWNGYFAALKSQPGIVVTAIEHRPPGYVIEGMKDPKADDPASLLRTHGLDPAKVRYEWQPYLSLNTRFARDREIEDTKRRLEKQLIRFEVNSSKVQLAEADKIAGIVDALRANPRMRITLTGRADETGSPATNGKLSAARADHVVEALVAYGINADRLESVAVGNTRPLRTGGTEWDQADNRSVAVRVH
jgi:outer membrane protein OmpA-like peptidoglycan-associated protein